jgi:hypothetical protein
MNTEFNHEALRRAIDPTTEEQLHDPSPYKTPRRVAEILYRGMKFYERPEVTHGELCHETISWRLIHNHYLGLRWVTVTEYAKGLYRLRNDVYADIPKKLWPFARPAIRNFELTFHWSEFTNNLLGRQVYEFCNAVAEVPFQYPWKQFEGVETYPQYAWTPRAKMAKALKCQPSGGKGL